MRGRHTPGPWRTQGTEGYADGGSSKLHPCFNGRVLNDDGQVIVSDGMFLGVVGATPEEAGANARLIATAPDLLEALEDMLRTHTVNEDGTEPLYIERWLQARHDAVAAVAKATK